MLLTRATILFVLFALAFGHYYYWHVREEILAAERNVYFVPAHDQVRPSPGGGLAHACEAGRDGGRAGDLEEVASRTLHVRRLLFRLPDPWWTGVALG